MKVYAIVDTLNAKRYYSNKPGEMWSADIAKVFSFITVSDVLCHVLGQSHANREFIDYSTRYSIISLELVNQFQNEQVV